MNRFEIPPLPKRVEEELALGEGILSEISNRRRGNIANMIFIDDASFKTDLKQLYGLPPRQISKNNQLDRALALGRQLGKYPNPIRLIDVNSERELHIPAEAFPEGLVDPEVEISFKKEFEFPKESSSTIGYIRVNGVEYPIISADSIAGGIVGNDDDVLFQMTETEYSEGSYREPTLDAFSQLRSGYKGGNTPNIFKSCNPCSKVNPKDVAKRRAKNKAARKNKRK